MFSRGNFLISFLLLNTAFVLFAFLLINCARLITVQIRLQSRADSVLKSSLLLKKEGLEKLALRWDKEVGVLIEEGSPSGILVRQENWPSIITRANQIGKALPGYKGRIASVRRVVEDSFQEPLVECRVINSEGFNLGVTDQPILMTDELGLQRMLNSAWLRREWEEPWIAATQCSETMPLIFFKGQWTGIANAQGRVIWDVDVHELAVQANSNGGYPRSWSDALDGRVVDPFRYPYYNIELMP